MSMQDFGAALGGAPGGAPPGLPADLGAPPDQGAPPDDQSGGGEDFANSLEALNVAEEALQAFIRMDPDHADRAVAAQCLQNVIKLKASNQDSAQAGDLTSLTRALQGGPSAVAGGAGAG
jgi:hypothetical protein